MCIRDSYCTAQGVDKKTAALYSELFDGHIGTVLAVARDEGRAAPVEKALELARAAAARDSYLSLIHILCPQAWSSGCWKNPPGRPARA